MYSATKVCGKMEGPTKVTVVDRGCSTCHFSGAHSAIDSDNTRCKLATVDWMESLRQNQGYFWSGRKTEGYKNLTNGADLLVGP